MLKFKILTDKTRATCILSVHTCWHWRRLVLSLIYQTFEAQKTSDKAVNDLSKFSWALCNHVRRAEHSQVLTHTYFTILVNEHTSGQCWMRRRMACRVTTHSYCTAIIIFLIFYRQFSIISLFIVSLIVIHSTTQKPNKNPHVTLTPIQNLNWKFLPHKIFRA
jgi:hypothetical protein